MQLGKYTIIITGASRGIGEAIADKFVIERYRVIGTYNGTMCIDKGFPALHKLDIASKKSIKTFVSNLLFDFDVDTPLILINNAGIGVDIDSSDLHFDNLTNTINTNLYGNIYLTQALLEKFKKIQLIINMTSTFSLLQEKNITGPCYSISKAALNYYTVWLSNKYPHIKTISYIPGWVRTDMGGPHGKLHPADVALDVCQLIQNIDNIVSGRLYEIHRGVRSW